MDKLSVRTHLLTVLVIVGAISYIDRFVFALALEPIKQDLQLSDSQIGLMTGVAFSFFYAIAGIPIARWADRGNRVNISAAAAGLLGISVTLCGFASNFFHLLIARAGVAIGEAGAVPSAQSLLADYFGRAERPRVMSIYFMGYSLAMIVGYLLGGWLIESFGWRITLMTLGWVSLFSAVLVKSTLKEPRLVGKVIESAEQQPLFPVLRTFCRQRSFRNILMAFCVSYFFFMGANQWVATFFIRSYGMSAASIGVWLALTFGVCGLLGNFLGAYFVKRFAANNEKLQMQALIVSTTVFMMANLMVYLSFDMYLSIGFIAVSAIAGPFGNGPAFAAIQSLVDGKNRSVAIAFIFLMANLIGLGFGPIMIGIISDYLKPIYGQESLRYALALFSPALLVMAFHYWRASISIKDDIRSIELESKLKGPNLFSSARRFGK